MAAIDLKITTTEGITLLTKNKYVPDDINVVPVLESKTINPTTSEQTVGPEQGYAGISVVTVAAIQTEMKEATPTNLTQTIVPTSGKYLSQVDVLPVPIKNPATITNNGTYTPDEGCFYDSVTVNVDTSKPEETKEVTIDSMKPLIVNPTAGHVMTKVTVTPAAPLADTSDATGVAADLLAGKIMYGANGAKITGTIATYGGEFQDITITA